MVMLAIMTMPGNPSQVSCVGGISSVAGDGNVFIDAGTLQQSGMAEQIAAVSPSVADQLPAALATGSSISIPRGELIGRIAPLKGSEALIEYPQRGKGVKVGCD
jgi:hypothetical protein